MTKPWMGVECSRVGRHGIHVFPKQWHENSVMIESIIRGLLALPASFGVKVGVCHRGGWLMGYRATGNIRITLSWKSSRLYDVMEYLTYRGEYDLDKITKWWLKHRDAYDTTILKLRVLNLYRGSGLIPQKICVAHNNRLKKKYGPVGMSKKVEFWKEAEKLGLRYVHQYSKCPKCETVGNWMETIVGIKCDSCGHIWEDFNVYACKWNGGEGATHE